MIEMPPVRIWNGCGARGFRGSGAVERTIFPGIGSTSDQPVPSPARPASSLKDRGCASPGDAITATHCSQHHEQQRRRGVRTDATGIFGFQTRRSTSIMIRCAPPAARTGRLSRWFRTVLGTPNDATSMIRRWPSRCPDVTRIGVKTRVDASTTAFSSSVPIATNSVRRCWGGGRRRVKCLRRSRRSSPPLMSPMVSDL